MSHVNVKKINKLNKNCKTANAKQHSAVFFSNLLVFKYLYHIFDLKNIKYLQTDMEDKIMTVIPKYETIKADDYKTLPPKQTAVECVLKAEEGHAVKKVLCISCDTNLLSVEGISGEARYSGRVDFKALYEDVSGEVNTIAYYADFSDKIEDGSITPVSQLFCGLSVADNETASVGKDEIKLLCVIEAVIKVNNMTQMPILSGGEGFLTNVSSANTSNFSGGGKDVCEVSDEFEEKMIIKKILLSDASVIISNVNAGVDNISAEGEAVVKLTYLCDNETVIGNTIKTLPFKHEIEAKDVLPSDRAFADCIIKTLKVNAVIDEEKEVSAVNISVDIEITARAYSSTCISYVDDVFSPDCKLNQTFTGINSRMFISSFNYKESIEGVANLDDDMVLAENVLAATGSRIHIANIIVEEGSITVEGIAVTSVLYSGTVEDAKKIASVNVEIPFSQKLEMAGCRQGDSINLNAVIFDVSAKSRKGKEIEVLMLIKMRADLFTDEVITVLSDIEVGEGEIMPQSSISIYYPGENERLWDISKQLGVSPDTIMSFNPDLKFPAGANSRIFIYRQKF